MSGPAPSAAAGARPLVEPGAAVPFTEALHHQVHQFLVEEAQLLDEQRYDEWLALLTDDIVYRMPVRVTTAGIGTASTRADMDHFLEDHYSLRKRIERLRTDYAWTEDPPSRVRHFVSNVRAFHPVDEPGDDVVARSYVLMYRSRGDTRAAELLAGERTDRLRPAGGGWRLACRDIVVDESVLRTQNLAIFV